MSIQSGCPESVRQGDIKVRKRGTKYESSKDNQSEVQVSYSERRRHRSEDNLVPLK